MHREELEKGVNLTEDMPSPFGKFQNVDGADRGLDAGPADCRLG